MSHLISSLTDDLPSPGVSLSPSKTHKTINADTVGMELGQSSCRLPPHPRSFVFITLYTVEGHQGDADVDFYSQVESLKTCMPVRTEAKLQSPMGDWREIHMGLSQKKVRTKQVFNKWITEWTEVGFILWHLYLALRSLEYREFFCFFVFLKRVYILN